MDIHIYLFFFLTRLPVPQRKYLEWGRRRPTTDTEGTHTQRERERMLTPTRRTLPSPCLSRQRLHELEEEHLRH